MHADALSAAHTIVSLLLSGIDLFEHLKYAMITLWLSFTTVYHDATKRGFF